MVFLALMFKDTKGKTAYDYLNGKITFLDQRLGALPVRDLGLYYYLKLDRYQYLFEIYADEQVTKNTVWFSIKLFLLWCFKHLYCYIQ